MGGESGLAQSPPLREPFSHDVSYQCSSVSCNSCHCLLPAGMVTPTSLMEQYRSLLGVLEEVGGGGDRAERVIRAVGEGLMRVRVSTTPCSDFTDPQSGQSLYERDQEGVENLLNSLETAILNRSSGKQLLNPLSRILPPGANDDAYADVRLDRISGAC